MSTPISAMMHSAARLPTPMMVSRRFRAAANGAIAQLDRAVELGDRALQVVQVLQRDPQQQGMVVAEAAAERWELLAQLSAGELGEHLGSRSPATSAERMARLDTPSRSEATESEVRAVQSLGADVDLEHLA